MNLRNLFLVALVAGVAGLFAGVSIAEEEAPSEADMMAKMMKEGMPGPHHKHIKAMEGEWTTKGVFQMSSGPMESNGTSSNKMVNGGRFLECTYNADFMGAPFGGKAVIGHNNPKKQFEMIWYDTMSSGIDVKKGTCSDDGKTMTFKGHWDGPMGKLPVRMVFTITGADSYMMQNFTTMQGQEIKDMEIVYTRKK